MTTDEAVKLLDQVLAAYQGTRKDHQLLAEALAVLVQATKRCPDADHHPTCERSDDSM